MALSAEALLMALSEEALDALRQQQRERSSRRAEIPWAWPEFPAVRLRIRPLQHFVLGQPGAGKSWLIERLCHGHCEVPVTWGRQWSSRGQRVCRGHAWAKELSQAQQSELGDAYGWLLKLPTLSEFSQRQAFRKALSLMREGFVNRFLKEMASAQATTSSAKAALDKTLDQMELVERSFLDRRVSVQVASLAGPVGVVFCDSGSTIFHVKELIQEQYGVPADWQVLVYGTQKLQDEDLLHWFLTEGLNSVKLDLVKHEAQVLWRSKRRNEHEEFESAHRATAAARERLRKAQEDEVKLRQLCSGKLHVVARCAASNGLLSWFQSRLAVWDEEAGTSFFQEISPVIADSSSCCQSSQDQPKCDSSCRFHPKAMDQFQSQPTGWYVKDLGRGLVWNPEQEEPRDIKKHHRAQKEELRFKQRAARLQMKGREAPLARPRRW